MALYLGDTRPEVVTRDVFQFALYADEILVINPFHNPWFIKPEFNPIENPGKYKSDTVKIVLFARLLDGWVREGLVTLIPDPAFYRP